MAARPLSEAVQQAEDAISGGNYQLAVETCRRVLGQFPEFATAHRLLAEAHLEEGDVNDAERAFHETLQRDPQSSAAYAGLATIAEKRGDVQNALAYAQVAWEIMPQRADLRDRVASLSERVYGKGGRLHLTRAALTSLHFRAGRWSRAAAEAASVLADHPTRVDVQLRMAEALWRRGSLPAAASACLAVLESAPSAVLALLMLADVERRQGSQETAEQLLNRARAIDPDGVRAADLVTIGSTDLAEFILPARMPEFDDSVETTAEVERPRIAPAPDFNWSQPESEDESSATDSMVSEAPIRPEAPAEDEGVFDVSLPDDAEIDAARPQAGAGRGYTSMLESLEGEGLLPFRLEGEEVEDESDDLAASAESEHVDDEDVFSLVSDEEIDAARPPSERPHGYTTLLNSLDETGLAPFEVDGEPGYPTEPEQPETDISATAQPEMASPSMEAESIDFGADLTAGWDNIDAEIARATPSGDTSMKGYTGELRDLDDIGVQPFSIEGVDEAEPYETEMAGEVEVDDTFGDDLSFLDEAPETEGVPRVQAESTPLEVDLTEGWAAIDEEIQNAIPSDSQSNGYTDELNLLTESGVEPFFVDEGEADVEQEPEVNAEPESVPYDEDVVSDDLAAGIDLWSFENEPHVETAETVPVEAEAESVSEADLFDFADDEVIEEAPIAQAEPVESTEDSVVEDSLVEPVEEQLVVETPFEADAEPVEFESPVEEDVLVEPVAASAEAEVSERAPVETTSVDALRISIAHLGLDVSLFERAREAKAELVAGGQIQGDLLLPGVEPPGPTLEDLEQMAAESPEDQAVRRQYAEALMEAEQFERAFAEYQWMFRRGLEIEQGDLGNLIRVVEQSGTGQAKGHRLLGAIYRRAGNLGMSARHYQLSLEGYRGGAGKEV